MRYWIIIPVVFLVLLAAVPFAASHYTDFKLNQFFIEEKMIKHNTHTDDILFTHLKSRYDFGWNALLGGYDKVAFEDPDSVFKHVFSHIPSSAMVYPTETYYYYAFHLPERQVSGNLRLLDAHQGRLHIGYFDADNPRNGMAKTFGVDDGLDFDVLDENTINISFEGKTVTFRLNDVWQKAPSGMALLPEEEFIARVQDESAIRFFLLYNNHEKTFYYILDEESGVEDRLLVISENYLSGEDSDFIFYDDAEYDRRVLVGVLEDNIYSNNYFDGPFDQVPPRLPLKERLLSAYPYTAYAGGIDEHGNFKGFSGTRVAISPYYDYPDVTSLLEYHQRCWDGESEHSAFLACLTYEWKKDFHKNLEQDQIHYVFVSQGWPANHHGDASLAWPSAHLQQKSQTWPPNHTVDASLQ